MSFKTFKAHKRLLIQTSGESTLSKAENYHDEAPPVSFGAREKATDDLDMDFAPSFAYSLMTISLCACVSVTADFIHIYSLMLCETQCD